jgi:hypothetical protein
MPSEKVTNLNQFRAKRRRALARRRNEPTPEQIEAIINLTEKIWMAGETATLREAYELAMDRLFPWWR